MGNTLLVTPSLSSKPIHFIKNIYIFMILIILNADQQG